MQEKIIGVFYFGVLKSIDEFQFGLKRCKNNVPIASFIITFSLTSSHNCFEVWQSSHMCCSFRYTVCSIKCDNQKVSQVYLKNIITIYNYVFSWDFIQSDLQKWREMKERRRGISLCFYVWLSFEVQIHLLGGTSVKYTLEGPIKHIHAWNHCLKYLPLDCDIQFILEDLVFLLSSVSVELTWFVKG